MRVKNVSSLLWVLVLLWGCSDEQRQPVLGQVSQSASLPPRFSDSLLVGGIVTGTSMAFAPDGRLFVCEQQGRLRVIQDGALLPAPFLTLDVNSTGERGLLGVALDPGFPAQPYLYVYYTARSPSTHNRLSRFTASGNVAVPHSEVVLLEQETLGAATNHNGGALHFGADGKLYVGVGDNARSANAQALDTLHGKMLRLNKDGSIPSDNPFFATAQGDLRAIWALGLRNPFSFDIEPGTGRLFLNDVGQDTWEEINEGVAGANYGWPLTEGPTTDPRFRGPLYAYEHDSGEVHGCAITGGAFYNPSQPQFPAEYVGGYFFADYCNGWIRLFTPRTGTVSLFSQGPDGPVDLDVGPDGSLYYLDRVAGSIHKIRYVSSSELPTILTQPASQRAVAGQPVTFTVSATGTPPLAYQWQRNRIALEGQTGSSLTLPAPVLEDSGARFRVKVSNSTGSVMSATGVLTVVADTLPVASILLPLEGALYSGGDTIAFKGQGTDAEDGPLPASAFTWRVDFHHEMHLHPFLAPASGITEGSFVVPRVGELSSNVWFRIHLEVRDSQGALQEVFRDVLPRKAKLRLATTPAGLRVALDGQPQDTPLEVEGVVGTTRTLGVESPQVLGGTSYLFDHWSDGGAATHELPVPATDTLYTAVFRPVPPGGDSGLKGEYFGAVDLTQPKLTRVDATVDFRWGIAAPDPSMGADAFSVRWTGTVVPAFSQDYTFYTQSNDGVRLWVDGHLLIDNWTVHALTENQGIIPLNAGQPYAVKLEFFESKGAATARLLWSSLSQPKKVIPAARLHPAP
jgi:glucose/arabinose dehydrogenase